METILPSILLVTWALLWILGGWWLSRSLFSLAPNEEGMVGLVVGLTAEVGLVNFIGRVLPFDLAIWTSAGIVFAAGAFFAHYGHSTPNPRLTPSILPVQGLSHAHSPRHPLPIARRTLQTTAGRTS